jgi:hypothetical protein
MFSTYIFKQWGMKQEVIFTYLASGYEEICFSRGERGVKQCQNSFFLHSKSYNNDLTLLILWLFLFFQSRWRHMFFSWRKFPWTISKSGWGRGRGSVGRGRGNDLSDDNNAPLMDRCGKYILHYISSRESIARRYLTCWKILLQVPRYPARNNFPWRMRTVQKM